MIFRPGPVFTNLLLADEINRASPKTQSALLEAMQERAVTLLGTTRPLPDPFFVLASQNPIELEGTYPLPEAQLDRFLFKLVVHHGRRRRARPHHLHAAPRRAAGADVGDERATSCGTLFAVMDRIFLPRPVSRYIARLVAATHPQAAEAPEAVPHLRHLRRLAAGRHRPGRGGPRASPCWPGRPTVGFEDVQGRRRPGAEPPPDPQLQGPARPGGCLRRRRQAARGRGRDRVEPAGRRPHCGGEIWQIGSSFQRG